MKSLLLALAVLLFAPPLYAAPNLILAKEYNGQNIAFFQAGSALLLALFGQSDLAHDAQIPEQSSGFPRFTLAHNVGSEAEVDALFAGFAAKNANIIKAPQKVFWGGYSGYLADPDGFLWEIAFNPFLQKLR